MKQLIDDFVEKILGRKINEGVLQYFRYLICGGIATVTDVSLLFVLTHFLGFHYLFAAGASFITGMVVNYTLNTILVFKSSGEIKKEFPLFALIGVGGLVWTEIIMWLLVGRLGLYVMIAKAAAIVLVLQWNFFMRKRFVFSQKENPEFGHERFPQGKMKILMVAATPFFSDRGCHVRIYNQAKYLKKMGVEVRICTYFGGEDIPSFDIERIKKVSWYKKTTPGFSWGKFWLDIKLIFLCRRAIRDFQPDVVHAHLYEGLGVGYIAKYLALRRPPIVVDLQGYLDEEFRAYSRRNFIARKIFVWLSKRLINRCDWLVLSGENLLDYMQKLIRNKNAISIIRDGIDLDLFEDVPPLPGGEIERIDKWKEGKKLLVYIGGLSDNKGVGELLEAFSKPNLKNSEWKLLVGGFGEDEQKYKNFVCRNGLGDAVKFVGRVKYFSLPAYLALADAAIDPKNKSAESSGKIANLMAAGLPIICFDSEFNRARLGGRGFYLNSMENLSAVLENTKNAGKIRYDLENLGEEKEARKLFEVFNSVIKSGKIKYETKIS